MVLVGGTGPKRDVMDPQIESATNISCHLSSKACQPRSNYTPKLSCDTPGKAKKKKMSVPGRILRLLESSKRLHFQNVSLSKKRQMCIKKFVPDILTSKSTVLQSPAKCGPSVLSFSETSTNGLRQQSKVPKVEKKVSLLEQCSNSTVRTKSTSSGHADDAVMNNAKGQSRESDHGNVKCRKEVVAIDCEMVGTGPKGRISALARCSIVDYEGRTVFDQYIKPDQPITDYRTRWSGIRKHHMDDATPFTDAREQVINIIRDKIVVGHAVFNDFEALNVVHPPEATRDTSKCQPLGKLYSGDVIKVGQNPGLKKLAKVLLDMDIQQKEHCSVEDAHATMLLYKLVEKQWEEEMGSSFPDEAFRTSFLDDHFWPDDLF